jgi:hypothetical protein
MIDVKKIQEEILTLPKFDTQIMLQGEYKGCDPFSGTGRIPHTQAEKYTVSLFDLPYINSLLERYKMYRSRVLILDPKKCYSYHQDPSFRIHIPVVTNPNSWLLIDEEVYKLNVGKAYLTNTKLKHTAINADNEKRIHIVGCTKDSDVCYNDLQMMINPVREI